MVDQAAVFERAKRVKKRFLDSPYYQRALHGNIPAGADNAGETAASPEGAEQVHLSLTPQKDKTFFPFHGTAHTPAENQMEKQETYRFQTPDGRLYEGEMKNGMMEGKGMLVFPSQTRYTGEFKANRFHGRGVLSYPEGFSYQGQFHFGKPHGYGMMNFPDGRIYIGDFQAGKFHGRGTLVHPDGSRYSGEFHEDSRTGHGVFEYANRFSYVGRFENNMRNGRGTLRFPDDSVYTGEFRNNRMTGMGTLTFPDGTRYTGNFLNSMFHGRGTIHYPDGRRFEGEFEKDRPHGMGRLIFPDGTMISGRFEKGAPVPEEITKTRAPFLYANTPVHLANDGHLLVFPEEMIIDNFLFSKKILHAYQKEAVPGEHIYFSFYLPEKEIFIQFWPDGQTSHPAVPDREAADRLCEKKGITRIDINKTQMEEMETLLEKGLFIS